MLCNIFDDVNAAVVAPVFVQNRDTRINSLVMSSIAHGLGELIHYIFSIYFLFDYKNYVSFIFALGGNPIHSSPQGKKLRIALNIQRAYSSNEAPFKRF